jgi:hypothetical protein
MCRGKNSCRRFDKMNGKCHRQYSGSKRGIAIYKQQTRKKRRIYFKKEIKICQEQGEAVGAVV